MMKQEEQQFYAGKLEQADLIPVAMQAEGRFYRVRKGEILIEQGTHPHWFYCLLEGTTQVLNFLPSGKMITVSTFRPPCVIGEMELIDAQETLMQVRATSDGVVFALEMRRAKAIGLADLNFLRRLCVTICRKERLSNIRVIASQGYEAGVRLAGLILENETDGIYSLRKTDTASLLGISYRHTEKLFSDLVEKGWLKKEGRAYRVLCPDKLQGLARELNG